MVVIFRSYLAAVEPLGASYSPDFAENTAHVIGRMVDNMPADASVRHNVIAAGLGQFHSQSNGFLLRGGEKKKTRRF